jgi:hypothetical protein
LATKADTRTGGTSGRDSAAVEAAEFTTNTSPAPPKRIARFLLPSVTDLIFILLLFSFAFGVLAPRLLWDGDIGWHIRDGQNILTTHSIPRVDSFSATMSGRTWYAWEWLYDALIAVIYNRLELSGVVYFSAVVIATTLAIVFRFSLRRGGGLVPTIILFLIGTVACSIHFLARPHVVGWLITVVWLWILDSSYRQALDGKFDRRLYWLPLLMVLWANLHGGFVLGLVLLGIYLAADGLHWLRCRTAQRAFAAKHAGVLAVVLASSGLTSMINPYGYHLHVHVYRYLTDRFLMQHIDEFRAPSLRGLPAQAFALLVLFGILGLVRVRGRVRWADALLMLFAAVSGFSAARNIPISAMLLIVVAAPLWSRSGGEAGRGTRLRARVDQMNRMESQLAGHIWPAVVVLAGLVICFQQEKWFHRPVIKAHFDEQRFPVRATDFLQQSGSHEPIFSLDSWGGYLIYRLYPEPKVFIDDRHDFYGDAILQEYLKVLHLESGWENVLDGWKVDVVLMPTKSKVAGTLEARGWAVSYRDSVAVVLVRRGKT